MFFRLSVSRNLRERIYKTTARAVVVYTPFLGDDASQCLNMILTDRDLPQLLTPDEIKLLLDNTPNPMYRALFMTIYGSGLRVSEAVSLKVSDIDSVNMTPLFMTP